MDGYSLTDKMRKARRRFRFTATEQALFHELVAVCNDENWRDVFDCSNIELCYALNINERTLMKARESLINAGLIYYKSGKSKRSISSYSFVRPFKSGGTTTVNNTTVPPTNAPTNKTTNAPTDKAVKQPDYNKLYKTKTETKTDNTPIIPKGDDGDKINYSSFMDFFNETFREKLSAITSMTEKRKKAIKARISEHGKESVRIVYSNILSSQFLIGNNDRNWKCDFDWIFKPSNYIKILEGNYNGKSTSTTKQTNSTVASERKESVRNGAKLAGEVLRNLASEEF